MPSTDLKRRDDLPGGAVLRDPTIQAVIGHGGFGIVYRSGHNELDLTIAIKEYLPIELAVREGSTVQLRSGTDRRDFGTGLRRFRDEAQALIDFDSHPSIVSCRDFFRANGTAHLVMAYEKGQSLAELLAHREAEGRSFTESDLLAVMVPLLEGMERVHAAGVLHRDIKPSNILIRRRDRRPVLIDFGAAKLATVRFRQSQAPYTIRQAALERGPADTEEQRMRVRATSPANVVYSALPTSAGVSRLKPLSPSAFGSRESQYRRCPPKAAIARSLIRGR